MGKNIITVATAWGSKHGGVNAFNYRLSRAISEIGHQVTCIVKDSEAKDYENLGDVKLVSLHAKNTRKWSKEDAHSTRIEKHKVINSDVIIVHDLLSYEFAQPYRAHVGKKPVIVAFIHTWYQETDYLAGESDSARDEKLNLQRKMVEESDYVFTSGGWIEKKIKETLAQSFHWKIHAFIPGRLDAIIDSGPTDSILTFGRLSLDTNDKKGAASLIEAYKRLHRDISDDHSSNLKLPRLVLQGSDVDTKTSMEIKNHLIQEIGADAKIDLYEFENFYELQGTDTLARLGRAKVVVTPSYVESFGLTSLEAACLGIPLIAPKNSGFYQDITTILGSKAQDSISWLKPSDFRTDAIAITLANSIFRILEDEERRRGLAEELASEIRSKWPTWRDSAKKLLEIALNEEQSKDRNNLDGGEFNEGLKIDRATDGSIEGKLPHESAKRHSTRIRPMLERALTPNGADKPFGAALKFLDWYSINCGLNELTPLQLEFERSALQGENCVFDEKRNILICGPTSSGKTTIANILMFQTIFAFTGENARVIYLSPTKALAHEKHRELQKVFTGFGHPNFPVDGVLVSTGDETSDDTRIVRGDFLIVSTVYEKANTLFSRNPSILNQVGLLVVDELHMFSDLERGPMLELITAKAQSAGKMAQERRVRDEEALSAPRILGISTDSELIRAFIGPMTRSENDSYNAPLVIESKTRPVDIEHVLYVPTSGGLEYAKVLIGSSGDTNFPNLEGKKREAVLESAIAAFNEWKSSTAIQRRNKERVPTGADRVLKFLIDRMVAHPVGHRLLVFVPSRAQAEEFAEALAEKRSGLEVRTQISEALHQGISHIEDAGLNASILKWATRGIYVHHSDLPSETLRCVEEQCQTILPPGDSSEVLIATTTLSYGVNLAISDVVITQQQYFSADRLGDAKLANLSNCEFHNMAGRAGRLGRSLDTTSTVNVLFSCSSSTNENNIYSFLQSYYGVSKPFESKVYVEADRSAEQRIRRVLTVDKGMKGLDLRELTESELVQGVKRFSLPYVRTILDAVRHLNFETVQRQRHIEPSLVSPGDLIELFKYTPFGQSELNSTESLASLEATFDFVLRALKTRDFKLVANPDFANYVITERGDAILNTGKAISAISSYQAFIDLWSFITRSGFAGKLEAKALDVLAPYFLVLGVVAQRDVMSLGAEYTYEGRKDKSTEVSDASVDDLMERFSAVICRLAGLPEMHSTVCEISKFIFLSISDSRSEDPVVMKLVSQVSSRNYFDKYTREFDRRSTSIAAFRLSLFTLLWIDGAASGEMDRALLPSDLKDKARRRFMGKPRFFEQISYGLSFVGTLVRTEHDRVRLTSARTALRLRRLSECAKLGFSPRKLPFARLVARKVPRQAVLAAVQGLPSVSAIVRYRSDSAEFGGLFSRSQIYDAFAKFYQDRIDGLSSVWAERGRSDEDLVMRNLSEMWSEFASRFVVIALHGEGSGRVTSLARVTKALFNGLDLKLDCAALGYGSATVVTRPVFQAIPEGMQLSYLVETEEREKRYEIVIVFCDVAGGELVDLDGRRMNSSDLANLKSDGVWVVLCEPAPADWVEAGRDFVRRMRKPSGFVRFVALDAFLVLVSSIIRGFVDTPHVLFEDVELEDTILLVDRLCEYFNGTIVGALQSAALEFDSVWDLE